MMGNKTEEREAITYLDKQLSAHKALLLVKEADVLEHLLRVIEMEKDERYILAKWQDEERFEAVQRLYNMYEFSDDFCFVEKMPHNHPGIFQLVETGMLTMQEAAAALVKDASVWKK